MNGMVERQKVADMLLDIRGGLMMDIMALPGHENVLNDIVYVVDQKLNELRAM